MKAITKALLLQYWGTLLYISEAITSSNFVYMPTDLNED